MANKITLTKAYKCNDKEIKELDLTGLEELTSQDLIDATRIYVAQTGMPPISEADMLYTFLIAYKITKLPIDFFTSLSARDGMKVKTMVSNFLFV